MLESLVVISLILAPGRQETSLKRVWPADERLHSLEEGVTHYYTLPLFLHGAGLDTALTIKLD